MSCSRVTCSVFPRAVFFSAAGAVAAFAPLSAMKASPEEREDQPLSVSRKNLCNRHAANDESVRRSSQERSYGWQKVAAGNGLLAQAPVESTCLPTGGKSAAPSRTAKEGQGENVTGIIHRTCA